MIDPQKSTAAVMASGSPQPAARPTSSRLALLATLLAIAAVACGSIIQSTTADPWLNVLFVLVLLLPVLRGELGRQHSWLQQYDQGYRRALLVAGLGWALVTACLYLVQIRPFIGDVDLFYYLCNARDMNNHSLTSNDCYSYFPGVYNFWRTVMLTVGQRLEAIQWTYLLVIVTNVLLVAAIVWRHSRCLASSLFAGCWLLVLASRFQATAGETELLATIPLLVAILYWSGQPLRGNRGWRYSLALGIGLALTLYAKQQAGLLALGALALLLSYRWRSKADQHQLRLLIAIPVMAVVLFLVAILMAGEGWQPLKIGLATVADYESEGSWWFNLYVQLRRDETAALAALFSGLVLAACCWRKEPRSAESLRSLEVILFLAIGALFTLCQLRSRAYHHYMLLAIPGLVISSVLLWREVFPARVEGQRKTALLRSALILLIFVPFLRDAGIRESFTVWRIPRSTNFAPPQLWHQQSRVAKDLQQLPGSPGETLYVVPARHNSVYFVLQTQTSSPRGYRFEQLPLAETDWSVHSNVLLLKPPAWDASDQQLISPEVLVQWRAALQQAGFKAERELPTMVLYQRAP
jgi:hypothetical protein